jgi:hypothetical protein
LLKIDRSNRDKAAHLYPHGPAWITVCNDLETRPLYRLQVGEDLLLVATASERIYLVNYALLKGWKITR